jgi:hypothetical protein
MAAISDRRYFPFGHLGCGFGLLIGLALRWNCVQPN